MLQSRVQDRCGDLLVVNEGMTSEFYGEDPTFWDHSVDFLHRTVRDFPRDSYYDQLKALLKHEFIRYCNCAGSTSASSKVRRLIPMSVCSIRDALTRRLLTCARAIDE
jgi:hypothetical protein